MEKADIVIIGAGVIGLAVAKALAGHGRDIVVIEKRHAFGRETSSRNSEVVHAGIYYVNGSLKARTCVEGRRLLYRFCEDNGIPFKRLGKLIVANDDKEAKVLEELMERGRANGVDGLRLLDRHEIRRLEPNIRALRAILSPSTGIVDTHRFMKSLESSAKEKGVIFAYGCEAAAIEKKHEEYMITLRDADGETLEMATSILINSAGLSADKIAQMAGIDIQRYNYKLHYSKGEYFRIGGAKAGLVNRLIYPPPETAGLGIHTVADLQGRLRLGPNAFYVDRPDYDVDGSHGQEFYESAVKYLPWLSLENLSPDQAGIRPKLQGPCGSVADFVIAEEADKGFPGLINLIGMESPGFTSSLSIANYVKNML